MAAEPFEIVAKPLIVGLALEQLLDRSAQLLVVHLGRPLQPQWSRAVAESSRDLLSGDQRA
jgi:hypothetical protein